METPEKNNLHDGDKMIRALCVLLFAIVLRDYSTGNSGSPSELFLASIIVIAFLVLKIVTALQLKRRK
jgi:hypothetical protein